MIGWLRRKRDETAREVRDRLGEDAIVRIDDVARFFGLESASVFQIRGNGCLAATGDEILFVLWLPRQEVRIENDQLIAFIRPAIGGHLYELDSRQAQVNLLATLDRRPEPYHETIAAVASGFESSFV